jgi:hypothetical protein
MFCPNKGINGSNFKEDKPIGEYRFFFVWVGWRLVGGT